MNPSPTNPEPHASGPPADEPLGEPLVAIENLTVEFPSEAGILHAVSEVSFIIPKGKTIGVVGESGCGKSVTAMSIPRIVARPGRLAGGKILLYPGEGKPVIELSSLPEAEMRAIRGGVVSMIFQEPMTSLNPVFPIGEQVAEAIRLHPPDGKASISRREAWNAATRYLELVSIPDAEDRRKDYPHQFSGGMRQRVMIAMALASQPKLLIADEPTTALDVTIQAQILDLLRRIQQELGMSILLITHDLGVVAEMADEVVVMYASKVVERARVESLFRRPRHPYTLGLFASRPRRGMARDQALQPIEGEVPNPKNFPTGCKFHPRCPFADRFDGERCRREEPELRLLEGSWVRCHFAEEVA